MGTVSIRLRTVVDLWGGHTAPDRARLWERDTLVNVWSTTKGVTALCAHMLADRGLLDLDAPVSAYWPEFAAGGKQDIPVRHLLSHRAGLAGPREPTSVEELFDGKLMTSRLAAMEPWWEPGTVSGYHAMSYGFLVGEVIRRIDGRSVGAFLREEVTGPLGVDFFIGLPESEDHRVAELVHPPASGSSEQAEVIAQMHPAAVAALANPPVGAAEANSLPWRRAELPAAGGHGTAGAVAQLYGIAASKGRFGDRKVLGESAVERMREGQGACVDLVLGAGFGGETEIGLGYWLSGPRGSYGPNPRAFGHDGYGGSFGLADPEAGLSIGYVMNRMGSQIADDPRKMALINAVYAAL
ncbi:CubicO group peptidase, beta-lactamase class C family [Streptosporangium subroseum]|uniref:CubicO group peptidase, beta-lactamase class C family n=1 Tax=Streptosporangium subroseum TaxID=106412 RepID=A0A239HNX3_9ACTN|nr:serine hydrolase domain-containing protein [Streptosporangium subroseum]SNS83020.1 CubicO group peptidase, beta-lactamase class C family [Streptosporangium subroseum]